MTLHDCRQFVSAGLHSKVVWSMQNDCARVCQDEYRIYQGNPFLLKSLYCRGFATGNAAECASKFVTVVGCAVQAKFYRIDIDNPDVQTSVSNHQISGVVSTFCIKAEKTKVVLDASCMLAKFVLYCKDASL